MPWPDQDRAVLSSVQNPTHHCRHDGSGEQRGTLLPRRLPASPAHGAGSVSVCLVPRRLPQPPHGLVPLCTSPVPALLLCPVLSLAVDLKAGAMGRDGSAPVSHVLHSSTVPGAQ